MMPPAIIPDEWTNLLAYREHLASRGYKKVYVDQRTAIARRACEACGGEIQLLALSDDEIPIMPGTTRYVGVQRRGILAFRDWVKSRSGVVIRVPTAEEISASERIDIGAATQIQSHMHSALERFGDLVLTLEPDYISDEMFPPTQNLYRTSSNYRSRTRRAVRMLQKLNCEVST